MTLQASWGAKLDIALAIGSAVFAAHVLRTGFEDGSPGESASIGIIVLAVVGCLTLFKRRTHAVPVAAAVLTIHMAVAWVQGNDIALAPAAAIALYTVGRQAENRSVLLAAVFAGVVTALVVALADELDDRLIAEFVGEAAQMLLAVALGDAVRNRKRRFEEKVEAEANVRVQAERLRIARDLHDVVAHGLSVIAVQSGVAAHLLDRDPEQAKGALSAINDAGRSSLEELRSMVGVLRADDGAELLPVPTVPDDFSAAEQQAALAGLEFYRSSAGAFPQSVSDSCVVTVHRIVQEALTNVARHAGSVRVDLHLEHGADAVTVSITNQSGQAVATERPLPTGGSGIVGMTERAESLGGSLRAEPLDDGGFRVLAEVPYRRVVS